MQGLHVEGQLLAGRFDQLLSIRGSRRSDWEVDGDEGSPCALGYSWGWSSG
jgi:hypothetical protein